MSASATQAKRRVHSQRPPKSPPQRVDFFVLGFSDMRGLNSREVVGFIVKVWSKWKNS